MRLVFPAGEHAPVDVHQGTLSIGSASDCDLVLDVPGVAARHAEIATRPDGVSQVRPLDGASPTVLNGRRILEAAEITAGDLLLFGRVGCSVTAARAAAAPSPRPPVAEEDDGRTRVRASLPRFLLRGLSGATLGKAYVVTDGAVIGRQADCDIAVPVEEISRHHARVRIASDGLLIEDLDSANGTFINDKRIRSELLRPGDELRLDTVRFQLVAPGMDARQQAAPMRAAAPAATPEPSRGSRATLWVLAAIVVALLAAGAARYSGLF